MSDKFIVDDSLLNRMDKYTDQGAGEDECWEWLACKSAGGYGLIQARLIGGGTKSTGAHRVAYKIGVGEIYHANRVIRHTCDNRGCVNPRHLLAGTAADNTGDMIRRGRQAIPRGEERGNTKLTDRAVREIFDMRAGGVQG